MNSSKVFLTLLLTAMATLSVTAKPLKTNSMYMFGMAASFKDSVIYVTDIQEVQGAWIETKNGFLVSRDQYSSQLKEYLSTEMKAQDRVPVVFFNMKKKKMEKLYLKVMKKYKQGYEVRYLNSTQFKFRAIEMDEEQ